MAFSDDDLAALLDEFVSAADSQIVTPRAHERRHGGNAGFSHFSRAVDAPETTAKAQPRKCYRCKEIVHDGGRLCLRHKEQHRIEANKRSRKNGRKEWRPDRPGRPPEIVRRAADAEVILLTSMLSDAMSEAAALQRRIASLKGELTRARKTARKRTQESA